MNDLFSTLAFGSPLLIDEEDFTDSFLHSFSVQPSSSTMVQSITNPITNQQNLKNLVQSRTMSMFSPLSANIPFVADKKWLPYFSGFPKDTIFGASDVNSVAWGRQSFGFFQVGHLFSSLDDMGHILQLSFLVRRAVRFSIHGSSSSANKSDRDSGSIIASCLYSVLPTRQQEFVKIHEALIVWWHQLPASYRFWDSLDVGGGGNDALKRLCISNNPLPPSPNTVLINLMFFAALTILHQGNVTESASTLFGMSIKNRNSKSTSKDIIRFAYRAHVFVLRKIYGLQSPPQLNTIPPASLVSSPIIPTLLMCTCTGLANFEMYRGKLEEEYMPNAFVPLHEQEDASGVDPFRAMMVPVLENIGQVWPSALKHVESIQNGAYKFLRPMTFGVQEERHPDMLLSRHQNVAFGGEAVVASVPTAVNSWTEFNDAGTTQALREQWFSNVPVEANGDSNHSGPGENQHSADVLPSAGEKEPKSWRDLQNEFEDEFLL